jgi:hypothetical protein
MEIRRFWSGQAMAGCGIISTEIAESMQPEWRPDYPGRKGDAIVGGLAMKSPSPTLSSLLHLVILFNFLTTLS